jgi:hypothetical protein
MEFKIIITIVVFLIISIFLYIQSSTFGNITEISKSVYPDKPPPETEKLYSGHLPGSYLGLSDAEKQLMFQKFVDNDESI